MTPYVTEILKKINDEPELLAKEYRTNYAVANILGYSFDKRAKFLLPEGTPPFKRDSAPLGMSPATLYQQVKKFYIFTNPDLNQVRREQLFIQLLESVHPTEAELMILVKDQKLDDLYPNITADLVVKAGIVKEENAFRRENQVKVIQGEEGRTYVVSVLDVTQPKDKLGPPPGVPEKRGRGRPKGSTKKAKVEGNESQA